MQLALSKCAVVLGILVAACSVSTTSSSGGASGGGGEPAATSCMSKSDTECNGTPATPLCENQVCVALPPGHEIGYRDGTAKSVTLTEIYSAGAISKLTDLAFHPEKKDELWAVGYGDNAIHRGNGVGTDAMAWKRILDPAAGHFMLKPPAIAMGTAAFFGTCGDNLNERGGGDGNTRFFMGPALFSTDAKVLGTQNTETGLGSHMDMLHNTPLCRGIAHVSANIFWVFNGYDSSLDKYDFHTDHGPGFDDHSDGEIYRYAAGKVKGVDGTPSHVFYDAEDGFLYVADTGNARIVRLDTTKGTKGAELERQMEPLAGNAVMEGTDVEVVVPAGTLTKPSGLEVHDGLLYVTDTATSAFYVFDKTGKELRRLEVDLPGGALAGMAFGPDGKLYFADKVAGKLLRIDPL